MNRLAIIPARGGSKRLPRKNILTVEGRPMLAITIRTAFESQLFDRIVVSTEDDEINKIAKESGAEVIDRPQELASDKARVRDVCLHVIGSCGESSCVDCFCVLTATSILRTAEDIRSSFQVLEQGFDSVASVSEYFFYPHAALVEDPKGRLRYQWPEIALSKGQEMPHFLVENGAINWCRTSAFLNEKELLCKNAGSYRMPKFRSIDVDTFEDYQVIQVLYRYLTDQNSL